MSDAPSASAFGRVQEEILGGAAAPPEKFFKVIVLFLPILRVFRY